SVRCWPSAGRSRRPTPAAGIVATKAAGPPPDRVLTVEVPPDQDPQAGAAPAAALLGNLQDEPIERDGVVPRDDALFFMTQDLIQIVNPDGHEGGRRIRGRPAEPGVVVGDEALPEIAIGRGHGAHAGDAKLVNQAVLQRAVDALTAPSRLWGITDDV